MFHVSVIVPNATTVVYGILYGGMHPIMYVISDGAGGGGGGAFTGASILGCKCISTTPIGAPIYIWPRAAIPPVSCTELPPVLFDLSKYLGIGKSSFSQTDKGSEIWFYQRQIATTTLSDPLYAEV